MSLITNTNGPTVLSKWRMVAYVDDFFSILEETYCQKKGHIRERKSEIGVLLSYL